MPQKRTSPVPAPAPVTATRTTKPSKGSLTVPASKYSPTTPELSPSSSTTPPSSFPASLARSSKKLTKAVRSGNNGHGHGHGNTKGTMKARRGPEAELSEDDGDCDDDEDEESEDDAVGVVEHNGAVLGERVIEGVEGKSAPKSEVSMHTLLDNAKARPQHQNISRGYELLTSPASRLVIPFDSITPGGKLRKVSAGAQLGSAPSSPGFADDIEWDWEDLCFEMDGVTTTKKAYADVVKA